MNEESSDFGRDLLEALQEVKAHREGRLVLHTTTIDSLPAERIKAIRKALAVNPREFAERFGVPARTIEGWEQGRRHPDPAASVLLRVIEAHPDVVEATVRNSRNPTEPASEAGRSPAAPGRARGRASKSSRSA